jgi:hypothetical protein
MKKLISLLALGAFGLSFSASADSVQKSDIAGICSKATSDAYTDYVLQTEKDVQKGDGDGDPGYYVPYTDSLAPSLALREQGIAAQKTNIERDQSLPAGAVDKMLLAVLAERNPTYTDLMKNQFAQEFKNHYGSATTEANLELKDFGAIVGCKVHGECIEAFRQVVTEAQYGWLDNSAILFGDLFVEVMTDPSYLKPLARVERLIEQRIKLTQLKIADSKSTDLFSDLKKSFMTDGASASDAEEKTWKVLAIYSIRGPAFDNLFPMMFKENLPVVASIALIGSALNYLDGYAVQHDLPLYSYSKSIQSRCDFTRPYHFWMAAYLGHQLKKSGRFSDDAIVSAVHGLEFVYEVAGAVATKQGYNAVMAAKGKGTLFAAYQRETQKSILFNDAGALYGVQGDAVVQDLDQRFTDTINMAVPSDNASDSLVLHTSVAVANVFIMATKFSTDAIDPIHVQGWTAILNPEISLQETISTIK